MFVDTHTHVHTLARTHTTLQLQSENVDESFQKSRLSKATSRRTSFNSGVTSGAARPLKQLAKFAEHDLGCGFGGCVCVLFWVCDFVMV